jgi:UDP-N-acetylglucosamine--N-acetylmuramyl-(pentapeptide) pyrophosphoryl-undecaprenol N-acetylglucosamine transferase
MSSKPHILFAGGGTLGHIAPGLAVAEQLERMRVGARISFAGQFGQLQRDWLGRAGYRCHTVVSQPAPRNPWQVIKFATRHFQGQQAAGRLLEREKVSMVVGLGGYASVPVCRAAALRGVPLVLLESNVVPGRANRWLAPWATLICTAWEETARYFKAACPVRVTGTPLRIGFESAGSPRADDGDVPGMRRLLVLGGSQGAHSLNEAVPRALYRIRKHFPGWQIVHQSGTDDVGQVQTLYQKLALPARVVSFVHDMPTMMRGASLAVSRAGGTTLAELITSKVPNVLVPYPHARDDHQRHNALAVSRSGGAIMLDERNHSERLDHRIATALNTLIEDPQARAAMSRALGHLDRPHAAWVIASTIRELERTTQQRAA